MSIGNQQDARYPIGRFQPPSRIGELELQSAIQDLAELPELLRNAIEGLSGDQLATTYREGGWTIRQLTHHLADSHINAFTRVRKALTEDNPVISAYDENAWAKLHDSLVAPVGWSIELIETLHARWVLMLQALSPEQWKRTFVHPESGSQTVELATLSYAWHGRHHLAHITHLRAEKNW